MGYRQSKEIISAGIAIASLLVQPALAETTTDDFTNTAKLLLVQQTVFKITGVQVNATDKTQKHCNL